MKRTGLKLPEMKLVKNPEGRLKTEPKSLFDFLESHWTAQLLLNAGDTCARTAAGNYERF